MIHMVQILRYTNLLRSELTLDKKNNYIYSSDPSNPESLKKLKTAEGVASLDDLLNKRANPDLNYESDEDFIDQVMKCIL